MRKLLRVTLVLVAAVVAVAGLAWSARPAPERVLAREELLVGALTLGVLALAASGFDLRDWF